MTDQTAKYVAAEGQQVDHKSLRMVVGGAADFEALSRDCVCFANGSGGTLLVGIEDGASEPAAGQRVDPSVPDRIRKRIGELTVNVQVFPSIARHNNGGEYLLVHVPRAFGVASTSDGRYFLRVGDTCRPVVGDDVLRLADERPSVPWERMTTHAVARASVSPQKFERLVASLRESDRVKNSVKEKSGQELLDHYGLAEGERLTNLGILLLGTTAERARLGCAPVVQLIRYDEHGKKVGKYSWDDYEYSPVELVELIWRDTPELQERYEIPDGLLRETVPAFDPAVLRELLVNALVHRPYTQRGDVYLNLHPDRLEVVNPGRLPLGVTPRNILHTSRRRNDGLARVFHDLRLMEREGSGFDLMYERLLATGRHVPTVREGIDSVMVSVPRRVLHAGVIELLAAADRRHGLSQREKITLGLLAQSEGLSGVELTSLLELDEKNSLRPWLGRLVELELVVQAGRTKGTRYFVPPELLRGAGLDRKTTLRRVQAPRLRALILEDLERYPDSSSSDLHRRIGLEIPIRSVRRMLEELVQGGRVEVSGSKRWTRYRVSNANR